MTEPERGSEGRASRGCWWCGCALHWNSDHDLGDVTGDPADEGGLWTDLSCSGCGAEIRYVSTDHREEESDSPEEVLDPQDDPTWIGCIVEGCDQRWCGSSIHQFCKEHLADWSSAYFEPNNSGGSDA
jgi:hypothetical protein